MANSLADLLANKWDEPAEIGTIKQFVQRHYNSEVKVKLQDKTIIISAPNSALAGALRMNIVQLQEELKTDKKLVIRIGS